MLSDTDAAYIAGLFDGEGSIRTTGCKNRSHTGYQVSIWNTDRLILDWVLEVTGLGNVYSKRQANPNWKIEYGWIVGNLEDVHYFLCQILPYTRVKLSQVTTMISIAESRLAALGDNYNSPISEAEAILITSLKEQNKKGRRN